PNLLVNGSFESFSMDWDQSWGWSSHTIPGWTSNDYWNDMVDSGHAGVLASDGSFWVDLDEGNFNTTLTQTVSGLTAGQSLLLQFDHANRTTAESGAFEVLWNGQIIATYSDVGLQMKTETLIVTALAGNNSIAFRAIGPADSVGASLDSVRLQAIDPAMIAGTTLSGLAGNDQITGSIGADTISGGTGDDVLSGSYGDDVYLFSRGDGQDVIHDSLGINELRFGPGIGASDVRLVRGTSEAILEIAGTSDRIDLGSVASSGMGIQRVRFDDGTVWTAATLLAMALQSTDDADMLFGSGDANVITGGLGDDSIYAFDGNDDLQGDAGIDRLEGGTGDDLYRYAPGHGADVIYDSAGSDRILIGPGIDPADLAVEQSADGSNLILKFPDGGRITIEDGMEAGKIEQVLFSDVAGTTLTYADLLARVSTATDDLIFGDSAANVMSGGFGNDTLVGRGGADTYRFARGDGIDTIRDDALTAGDTLEIAGYDLASAIVARRGAGSNDVVIRFADSDDEILILNALPTLVNGVDSLDGIELIRFTDTGETLTQADLRLAIMAGAATDGDDRIDALASGTDVIELIGLNISDIESAVRGGPDSYDFVITFKTTGDRLVLSDALSPSNAGAATVTLRFADGTVWNRPAMLQRAVADADGSGNDNVYGFETVDDFAAKAGNDLLVGGDGSDNYYFARGSGQDTISDLATSTAFADTVRFLDFASTDAEVSRIYRGSDTVVISFTSSPGDSVTIIDALANDRRGVESYQFSDGVVWTRETIRALLDNRAPVANDDGFWSVITGQPLIIKASDLLRNDFDADGNTIRVVSVDAGEAGTATLNASGDIVFTATNGFWG